MAKITNPDMQQMILDTMSLYTGEVSMSTIAADLELPASAVRYSIDALVEQGRLRKIPVVSYNKSYRRYRYEVVE